MKVKIILILVLSYASFGFSQSIDFDMGFQLPFVSSSIVKTKYDFLTDDPSSYNFAKIKNKTQYNNELSMSLFLTLEYSYKMFGLKVQLSPYTMINRSFTVYFADIEKGEKKYTGEISHSGFQIQPLFKFSFKTIGNNRFSLLGGGYYFSKYKKGLSESAKSRKSDLTLVKNIYKYMLYDDTKNLYGYSIGLEHAFLNNKRSLIRQSIIISPLVKKIGFEGFSQVFIQYQIEFFNFRLFQGLKKQKIYLEN